MFIDNLNTATPPPPPPPPPLPVFKKSSNKIIIERKNRNNDKKVKTPEFAPPSLQELQITLSKLKNIDNNK